jgi:hypothetical protein
MNDRWYMKKRILSGMNVYIPFCASYGRRDHPN